LVRQQASGEGENAPRDVPKAGTFRWLCIEYFKSTSFVQLDPRTQRVTKLIIEKTWLEPIARGATELFGDCPLSSFGVKAVRILRDRRLDRPEAANNRLRRLRRIFAWAMESGIEGVAVNPARDVSFLKPSRSGGFPTWTSADIVRFEERHPVGSKARLALGLLCYTGIRRSDVVQLGRQHMQAADESAPNGRLVFRPFKGRNRSPLTLNLPVVADLHHMIAATKTGELAFLVTERGKPFTSAGFGNWFRQRCDEAGLSGKSAHGVRKAAASRLVEKGATTHQLMAIFGWLTIKQAELYTRGAERKRLAEDAMHLLGTNRVAKSLTSDPPMLSVRENEAKKLG